MNETNYAAIDFETAYWGDGNACALGIVVSDGHEVVDEWYHLIRPQKLEFNPGCVMVNHIYPEDVIDEEEFDAFWDDIRERLNHTIVFAHNARFDMGVLRGDMKLYKKWNLRFRYGDTVALSRKLWKDLPNHKLNTVAEALGFDFNHHQALDDARACEYIVRKALEQTGLGSVEELMKATGQELKNFPMNYAKRTRSNTPEVKS